MKMSSGSLSNAQQNQQQPQQQQQQQQTGRFPTARKGKKHNNEYNHDMEKHLQAHLNETEFTTHDSFLKKFSTRTQHGATATTGGGESSLPQIPYVQSHSSLPMSSIDTTEGELKSSTNSRQLVVATKQRCSFKLEDQPADIAESKEDSLEAGLMTNLNSDTDGQSSLIRAAAAATHRSTSISPALRLKKKINKSMSLTSNVSSASTSQFEEQSCFTKLLIKCNYLVFGPDDNPMFVWLIILNVCVLYNTWLIIARQSFEKLQTEYQNYWRVADSIADSVYFIDVVVQFRTGYLEQGLLVYDSKKLALNYMKSKNFILDLFALTPLELIQLWYGYSIPILRFPRFFKLYRTVELYYITESRTLYPNVWRVANLTHILFCLGHWFAGFYFLISKAEGFKGHWSYPEPVDEFALLSRMYLRSLYWSTLTLTTIGDLPPPETNWQWLKEMSNFRYLFSIAVHYLAVFVIALIVGQVGNVITNRNANRVEFERLLDGAKQYMRNHNVPTEMQKRVQRWYDYSWSRGRMNGSGDIHSIGLLPDKLKTELALHVNLETLRKVTIFQECQPEFLHDLVLKMRASIFTPGDVICRRGEIAREMFIIADGVLEVIGESGDVLTKMYSGDFFGEIGILNIEGASNKRTADVRSVGYAELFSLSKEDVLTAVKDYPEAERILIEYGRRRLNQNMARQSAICKGPPNLKITNESIGSSKGDSQDNLDAPSTPSSLHQHHHHHHPHHHRRMSVAKLLSMKERAKFESSSPDTVDMCASNDSGGGAVVAAVNGGQGGLTTDMLGLPTLLAKQPQSITSIDPSRIDVQSLINAVLTSDKVGEREKWLEIELINASVCKTADSQRIVNSLEQISNMCLSRDFVNMDQVMELLNKLKDEVEHKKDSNYDNFFQLVEQKDAKIKLLESRIKILQKYLTQRDVFS